MEPWHLRIVGAVLHLLVGEEDRGEVVKMKASKALSIIKMQLISSVIVRLNLEDYDRRSDSGCGDVLGSLTSRKGFIGFWEKYVRAPRSTSESTDSEDIGDTSIITESSSSRDDDSESDGVSGASQKSVHDMIMKEYLIGTFPVHIMNLCPPSEDRATRLLDHKHVSFLEESFQNTNQGQIVVLAGMLQNREVDIDGLREQGNVKVEVLGGNHTREALQSMFKRGTLMEHKVNVLLYRPLSKTLALSVGYHHNDITHEKKKSMTFMDKVRLMRHCMPRTMGRKEAVEWKDNLCLIFKVKDRRRFQQTYSLHLSIAQLTDETFNQLLVADGKVVITEKFLRQLIKLEHQEDIAQCVDVLVCNGVAQFHKKVKEHIDAGRTKKKRKMKIVATEDVREVPQEEQTIRAEEPATELHTNYQELLAKYEKLLDENQKLVKENKDLKDKLKENRNEKVMEEKEDDETAGSEKKRTRNDQGNLFTKGDKVKAFWRDDQGESWLDATILFPYSDGRCKVRWASDGLISTLPRCWIKKQ